MKITKDGDHYLVAADNFINLQESKDYFFISEEEYQRFKDRKVGIHGKNCPHCLGNECECYCSECRPDLVRGRD